MATIKQYGFVENGTLKLLNRKRFTEELRQLKDCDVQIIVKRKGKASDAQRRYYFGVVIKEITVFLRDKGNDVDEELVHEMLKLKFNKQCVFGEGGEVIGEVPGTTTDHNIEERIEYINSCVQWAEETLGLVIPEPNTQTQLNF